MEILENSEEFIEEVSSIATTENDENSVSNSDPETQTEGETKSETETTTSDSETSMIEYKEMEEPCVALSIISENRLTNTEVFIRRGIRYSIKAFFSAIVLTVIHLFM